MFIQKRKIAIAPKQDLIISLPYLGKKYFCKFINTLIFVSWKLFWRIFINIKATLVWKILFLKDYGQIVFHIFLRKSRTFKRSVKTSTFQSRSFKTSEVSAGTGLLAKSTSQKYLLKVLLLWMPCLFVTIK